MKKKDSAGLGMTIPKRMRMAGMTFYLRYGQVVGRESSIHEKRSNTLPQFIQRQKMRHTTALWKMLRFCDVMFTERRTAYQNFASLANFHLCGKKFGRWYDMIWMEKIIGEHL